MAYTFQKREKLATVFFTAGFVGLVIIAILFLSQRNLFRIGDIYYTEFKSSNGIRKSSLITLHDVPVGIVKDISITDNNTVYVEFLIYKEYVDRIRADSVLVLQTQIIGTRTLVLYPGTIDSPLIPEGGMVLSSDSPEGRQYRAAYDRDLSSSANIDNALLNANIMMSTLNDPTIGLSPTLREVNSILVELNNSMRDGTLRYLLNDTNVVTTTTNTLKILESSLSNIYYLSEDAREFSSVLKYNKDNLQTIIDNTVEITDNLVITTSNVNKIMPDMESLVSNAAFIASNVSPLSKDIKDMNRRFK